MPLLDLKTDLKSLRFGKDRKGGGNSGQPYIKTGIPETPFEEAITSPIGVNDFLLRGGLNAVTDTAEDVLRLGKMFTSLRSPSGLLFTAKQNLLSRTAVRTQTSGILNEGTYTPLSTLAQAGVNAFGGHLNKQGINPFALTGAYSNNPNLYSVKVKSSQPTNENRLIGFYDSKIEKKTSNSNLYSYIGGPGSDLGIGKTNIRFARGNRTGINNPKLAGTSQLTQQFIAPTVGQDASRYYDYSAFKNKTQGTNLLKQVETTGVTKQWALRKEEDIKDYTNGLINEEGQIIRGGQDATGEKNSLAVARPGYFYGEPGKTGKEPFTPGNYLQSLSLLSKGSTNSLNRNWNSVSRTFQDSFGNKVNNEINEDGDKLYTPSVYKKDPEFGFQETNPEIASSQGSAALTQDQVLSQILSRNNGTTQIRDFRKQITPNTIGTKAYNTARENGTLTDAPKYSGKDAKNYEQRVNAGDPGKKGLIRTNYSKGAIDLATEKPYVVNEINAMYMYVADNVTDSKKKNDFVKLRFAVINPDQPTEKTFVHFPAFFDGAITDNMSAGWDSFKYLGRAEEFYNYTGFSRDISFSFTVAAQSKPELSLMYQKLNYLQSSLTPNYNITDGFMRGNIHQLTLGGYFYEQPGVLTSLNYTMPQDSPWEIGIPADSADGEDIGGISYRDPSVKELTHMIQVQVSFKPIHTFLPQIVGSALDRIKNIDGVFGAGNIDQKYIALTNDGDGNKNNLYSKGTLNRTYIPEYGNRLGLGGLEPSSDTAEE
jgi:hypothetical protein